jgi:hypothetical protein
LKWRRSGAVVIGILHLFSSACFAYTPVETAPATGAYLAVEVNDAGRSALAPALGPGVLRLEGTLVAVQGDGYLLDAKSVMQNRRQSLPVDGIRVTVSPTHVVRIDERRLSRGRTWALFGTGAAVVVGFFLTNGWFGRRTPPEDGGPGPGPDQYRW